MRASSQIRFESAFSKGTRNVEHTCNGSEEGDGRVPEKGERERSYLVLLGPRFPRLGSTNFRLSTTARRESICILELCGRKRMQERKRKMKGKVDACDKEEEQTARENSGRVNPSTR
ncbi:hypothetical protein V1477_018156 [Vespula maculifrons]|uniref:Uncharacterized protein n=1 Tax=Vespula maculifrons TaxID=7453 RepID=A0ABD2AYN0_VESMC